MTLSAAEQYLLELTNRARLDPLAEADRQGIDLNANLNPGTISTAQLQALAPNSNLDQAAHNHSAWMFEENQTSHEGINGSSPGDRMGSAGYQFSGSWTWAENIAWEFSSLAIDLEESIITHHNGLYGSAGHRVNIFSAASSEVGIGQVGGIFSQGDNDFNGSIVTLNFADSNNQTFVTGVAYRDTDGDGFYSIGEGLSDVTISVGSSSDGTAAAGGYAVSASAQANVAVSITQSATGLTELLMDLSEGNGKLDVVQDADGTWGLEVSTSAYLQSGIAQATLLGMADLTLGGSAANNTLTGNRGDNEIFGRDGDDTIEGGAGDDRLFGGSQDDLVSGGTGNDRLSDGWGNDTLTGGAGSDVFVMAADHTNDTITDFDPATDQIDLSAWSGTPIIEQTAYGMTISLNNDVIHVYSAAGGAIDPATLNENTIIGAGDTVPNTPEPTHVEISGTVENDAITGSDTHDQIMALAGHDTLFGGEGDDALFGDAGNDILNGGAGDDVMEGGTGNDRYVVDSTGDIIQGEIGFSQGGGIDTVESWVSFTLTSNLEILRLQGTADINGTGGFAPEAIVGQTGDNVLDGGGGYDVITAKDGDDTLIGGLGADSLVGDEGADVFVFNNINESRLGQANRDFINGFENGVDRIDLSGIDANTGTTADDAFTFIDDDAFSGTAGELRHFTFGGGNFNIVEADVDGDGVADMQIFVNLTNEMFVGDFIL